MAGSITLYISIKDTRPCTNVPPPHPQVYQGIFSMLYVSSGTLTITVSNWKGGGGWWSIWHDAQWKNFGKQKHVLQSTSEPGHLEQLKHEMFPYAARMDFATLINVTLFFTVIMEHKLHVTHFLFSFVQTVS